MKKIQELTEQEVLALTSNDIENMINVQKAELGIKLLSMPNSPNYHTIPEQDKKVFSCELFGNELCFEAIGDLNVVIDAISKAKVKGRVDYDYNKTSSGFMYLNTVLKNPYQSTWDSIKSMKVYSMELYNSIVEKIQDNKKMKTSYEQLMKEYKDSLDESKEIENEIRLYYYEICAKYERLGDFCRMMKFDYMPLANQDQEVALRFLTKAYSLDENQKTYVLENYKNI